MTTSRPPGAAHVDRAELVAMSVVIGGYLVIAARALSRRVPLGHDESVYSLRGRDFLEGWSYLSGHYWIEYRAPGLPLLLSAPFRLLGASSTVARLVVVGCGFALVVLTWAIARRLASPAAAVTAAASLCLTTGVMSSSTMVLADVPGAAFSLAAVWALLVECQAGRLRWSPVAVPGLVFIATLCRYGSPIGFVPALVGVGLIGLTGWVRGRRWRQVALLAGTALGALVVVALVTMTSLVTVGRSPFAANSDLVGSKGLTAANGFREFWALITPFEYQSFPYWNRATMTLTVIGLVAAIVVAIVDRSSRRGVGFGLGVGAITLVGLLVSVGRVDHNYLVMPAPYIAVAVGVGWAGLLRSANVALRRWPHGVSTIAAAASIAVVAACAMTVSGHVNATHGQYAGLDRLRTLAVETGRQLGPDCGVVSSYTPQVGWYSECRVAPMEWLPLTPDGVTSTVELAELIASVHDNLVEFGVEAGAPTALLAVEGGKRQPADPVLWSATVLYERVVGELGVFGEGPRHVVAWLIDDCVFDQTCPVDT
jgi:Dolichyl-phosphate-mannose-protein mannosyltransferase